MPRLAAEGQIDVCLVTRRGGWWTWIRKLVMGEVSMASCSPSLGTPP